MNTRLTQDQIAAKIAKIKSDNEEKKKKYGIRWEYAMSTEQAEAWTCLRDCITEGECSTITIPLSDIWQENLPGTENTTVKVTWFDDGLDADYYMGLYHNGTLYDTEFEDVFFRMGPGFFLTEINDLPASDIMESIYLHSKLVSLMIKAGIFEDKLNK